MTRMILHNAKVATMDARNPWASLVAIENGRISFVGNENDGFVFPNGNHQIEHIDCNGDTVIPGFHDAHLHLDGMATYVVSVDCSSSKAESIHAIQSLISERVKSTPPGQWIRARGYHEMVLADGRHPTRYDLDLCAPANPVKLTHQSGHGSVLNSFALALIGVDEATRDLPGGMIERMPDSNIPSGVVLEMEDWLFQHIPQISDADWIRGIRYAKDTLVSHGVTSFQDATVTNSFRNWGEFRTSVNDIGPPLRATVMIGKRTGEDTWSGPDDYGGQHFPRLGHTKIMITAGSGTIHPNLTDIAELLQQSHLYGVPLAVHAVEIDAIAAALEVWRSVTLEAPQSFFAPHRFEHCPESPAWVIQELRRFGISVVVNPGFIYYNGDRYLDTISGDGLNDLYPFRSMKEADLLIAAGSDSPVIPVDPIKSMYGAVFRKTSGGRLLNPLESISVTSALDMHTIAAAKVTGLENVLGSLTPGKYADMAVLSSDPWVLDQHSWESLVVRTTIINGEIIWSKPA